MKLELNLAREDGRPRRGWRAAAWAAGAVLVAAVSVANGMHYRSLAAAVAPAETRLRALEDTVKRLEAQHAAGLPAETRAALSALPARVEAYNQILTAAAFSWTALLMELEAALPARVTLTGIQPDPATGSVTLQGLAKGFPDAAVFVHQLENRALFHDVILLRHTEQGRSGGSPDALQEFSIRLQYRVPGRRTAGGA